MDEHYKDIVERMASLRDALDAKDALGSVVRAHIILEKKLNELIDVTAIAPEFSRNSRRDFQRSVEMALVLGMQPALAPSLRSIGKIRNAFAHGASESITMEHISALRGSLPHELLASVHREATDLLQKDLALPHHVNPIDKLSIKGKFSLYTIALWVGLDTEIQKHYEKKMFIAKELYVITQLRSMTGVAAPHSKNSSSKSLRPDESDD